MIKPICDFCHKELKEFGGILLSPPKKNGEVKKMHLCGKCYKKIVKLLKLSVKEIEDILSVGPTWLRYTRKVRRSKK